MATAGTASAQLIPVRPVPFNPADGFEYFPSYRLGMGGVSIALSDTLGDLSANPAAGARLTGLRFVASPVLYDVSERAGGGRALPLGVVARAGSWYGGIAVALQRVDPGRPGPGLAIPRAIELSVVAPPEPSRASRGNAYTSALVGRSWSDGLSVGGSVSVARRSAVDGVDLLYVGSDDVIPSGRVADLRLGVLKEWPGDRSLEAVVLYSRVRMAHEVKYREWFWDPDTQVPVATPREEWNADHRDTWGVHLVHQRPLPAAGWRIGWLATANRVGQPGVPHYDIAADGVMSAPSGRGDAYGYNVGVGVSRVAGPLTFGIDAIYEPIWSRVWSDAEKPVVNRTGETIAAGERTVESHLRYSNALMRTGVAAKLPLGRPGASAGLSFGLALRSDGYRLTHLDHVRVTGRKSDDRWTEWTPTWGVNLRFPDVQVRYHMGMVNGARRPGGRASPGPLCPLGVICSTRATITVPFPPPDPRALGRVSVVTHQLSVAFRPRSGARGGGER